MDNKVDIFSIQNVNNGYIRKEKVNLHFVHNFVDKLIFEFIKHGSKIEKPN